jgi:hypothetical protein
MRRFCTGAAHAPLPRIKRAQKSSAVAAAAGDGGERVRFRERLGNSIARAEFTAPLVQTLTAFLDSRWCCHTRMGDAFTPHGCRSRFSLHAVFGLRCSLRLPLHVRRRIRSPALQRYDVIDHIAGAGSVTLASRRAWIRVLELMLGLLTARGTPFTVALGAGRIRLPMVPGC